MSHLTSTQTTLLAVGVLLPPVLLGLLYVFADFKRRSSYLKTGPVVWLALMPAVGFAGLWLAVRVVERNEAYTVTFGRGMGLYAVLLVDLLVLALWYAFLRKGMALERFARSPLAEVLTPTVSLERQFGKASLVALAAFGVALALAEPQWGRVERKVRGSGRDVMILMDVSKSMLAEDLYPSRLERAKADVRDLVDELEKQPGFRVGLVAFAGSAVVKCPLTLDYGYFKSRLDDLSPASVSQGGTMIGDAIRVALRSFPKKARGFRDMILITDGEDHESFPEEAAKEAKDLRVPIYTVGLGDPNEGRRIPVRASGAGTRFLTHDGQEVWSKLHDKLLLLIADITGGVYVRGRTKSIELDRIFFERIAVKEKRELEQKKQERKEHRYQVFLGLALLLLFVESFIIERGKRA